jgi:hypothetical protein
MAALQANHAQEQLAQTHIQDQQAADREMAHEMGEEMSPENASEEISSSDE